MKAFGKLKVKLETTTTSNITNEEWTTIKRTERENERERKLKRKKNNFL